MKGSTHLRRGETEQIRSSFRDPAGVLISYNGRILRLINNLGTEDLNAFVDSETARRYIAAGKVVSTKRLSDEDLDELLRDARIGAVYHENTVSAVVEHARIPFPSFPYEWPAEMLEAAGHLTLELARECLAAGLGLKDATPLNILFRGPEPVFVDVLSFEQRDPHDPTWLPYAQFVRTFLLPLMANRRFGIPTGQVLLNHRDGLEPEHVYRWLSLLDRLRPLFLTNVSIPVWLASRGKANDASIYRKKTIEDANKAQFVVESLLRRLERALRSASPPPAQRSIWSSYMSGHNNYSGEQFEAKQAFVTATLQEFTPKWVLDVGCNTGVFSEIAARAGASVVALDYDPVVAGQVWCRARAEKLDILPLVVDLTRPTPAIGWMNGEWPSFLERARGRFDALLMLAVIHHMLVSERVPLSDIMGMAAQLTTNLLIVEFIEPSDSMFQHLLRGRGHLHQNITVQYFEQICGKYFNIVRSVRLPGAHRSMYVLQKKAN